MRRFKINLENLKGLVFGRLTILNAIRINSCIWCNCKCSCGKEVKVRYQSLKAKNIHSRTQSCGCYMRQHRYKKHGMWKSKVYAVWSCMLQRCSNKKHPQYKVYGGAGIKVCHRWLNFCNFIKDMGEPNGFTLDRINNLKGYKKSNCRWATYKQQIVNRNVTHWLNYKNENLCLSDWATKFQIKPETITARLRYGCSTEEALTLPIGINHKKFREQETELEKLDVEKILNKITKILETRVNSNYRQTVL